MLSEVSGPSVGITGSLGHSIVHTHLDSMKIEPNDDMLGEETKASVSKALKFCLCNRAYVLQCIVILM